MKHGSMQLLTLREAEALTQRKVATWRKDIRLKKIAYVRIGRSVRIPREVIEQMVQQNWQPADGPVPLAETVEQIQEVVTPPASRCVRPVQASSAAEDRRLRKTIAALITTTERTQETVRALTTKVEAVLLAFQKQETVQHVEWKLAKAEGALRQYETAAENRRDIVALAMAQAQIMAKRANGRATAK